MARAGKYGTIEIPGVKPDEPVFILRAQDMLAEATIGIYKILAASHNSPLSGDLDRQIQAFQNWTGPKKMPD